MIQAKYVGRDPELIGHTALVQETDDPEIIKFQIDEFTHQYSHCWKERLGGCTMGSIEQLFEQKKLISWEIKLQTLLPIDLRPWTVSNICIDPELGPWDFHAWLSYKGNIFKRLEAFGFEPLEVELIRWNQYRPSVCLLGRTHPTYKLTEAWPMCPMWMHVTSFRSEVTACYLWNGYRLRVTVPRPRNLTLTWDGVAKHPMSYHVEHENTFFSSFYWEYQDDITMTPAEMYAKLTEAHDAI